MREINGGTLVVATPGPFQGARVEAVAITGWHTYREATLDGYLVLSDGRHAPTLLSAFFAMSAGVTTRDNCAGCGWPCRQ